MGKGHPHLARQQRQQHCHAVLRLQPLKGPNRLIERTAQHLNLVPRRQSIGKPDDPVRARARHHLLNEAVRRRRWLLAKLHEPQHPDRRIDRPPAVPTQIEPHKQIAREKRSRSVRRRARLLERRRPQRQIGRKTLPIEMNLRQCLFARLRADRKPAISPLDRTLRGARSA